MTLRELITGVDRSPENEEWVDIGPLAELFGLDLAYAEQSRLKAYWFHSWICTDRRVGGRVYFLDDNPVGVSWQSGRKADEQFRWLSRDAAGQTMAYLRTLLHEDPLDDVVLVELDAELEGFPRPESAGGGPPMTTTPPWRNG